MKAILINESLYKEIKRKISNDENYTNVKDFMEKATMKQLGIMLYDIDGLD